MSTNIIKMYRGDNYEFALTIDDCLDNGQDYVLTGNDAVYFALMEPNGTFEDALIAIKLQCPIEISEGVYEQRVSPVTNPPCGYVSNDGADVNIMLPSFATTNLLPGVYYYSVKLDINHPDPDDANTIIKKTITIINKTKFIILE